MSFDSSSEYFIGRAPTVLQNSENNISTQIYVIQTHKFPSVQYAILIYWEIE